VALGPDPVITGYVDGYRPRFGSGSHSVAISGVSMTGDLADCSAMVPGGQFSGYGLAAIARALARPFGVEVVTAGGLGGPIADVQITPGEKVAEILGRLAAQAGATVWDDERGRLVIGRAGSGGRAAPLVQGEGLLEAEADFDMGGRFSPIVVRAQQPSFEGLDPAEAAGVEARAADGAVPRYRPLLIAGEASMDTATAGTRARWERAVRAGRGIQVKAVVKGWRQPDGRLWRVNQTARVTSDWLGLDRDLLIAGVRFTRDASGTRTGLSLTPPSALTPDPTATAEADPWAGLDVKPIGDDRGSGS
jgi:prophage tail gpP-like protein